MSNVKLNELITCLPQINFAMLRKEEGNLYEEGNKQIGLWRGTVEDSAAQLTFLTRSYWLGWCMLDSAF